MILRYHFRHSRSPSPFGTVHLKQTYNVAPAALRSNCLTFCRNKVSVVNDLVLNFGKTALVAILLQAFEDDIGICRSLKEQVVDDYRVAGEDRIAFFPACVPMGEDPESVLLCIRSLLRLMPVLRKSSARLTFFKENLSPRSAFICCNASATVSLRLSISFELKILLPVLV